MALLVLSNQNLRWQTWATISGYQKPQWEKAYHVNYISTCAWFFRCRNFHLIKSHILYVWTALSRSVYEHFVRVIVFFFALAILGLSLKLQNQLLRKYKQMPPAFLVSLRISGLTDQVSKLWSASFKLLYRKQTGNFTTHVQLGQILKLTRVKNCHGIGKKQKKKTIMNAIRV